MRFLLPIFSIGCFADTGIKQYNDTPEIEIASHIEGSTFGANEEVVFRALVSDLNHSNDLLLVQWLMGTTVVCEQMAPTITGESVCTVTIAEGESQVQAEVRDPEGGFAVDILRFSVESNAAPSTPTISIEPDPAGSGDLLSVNVSGSVDPDGDPISYRYVWFHNDIENSSGATIAGESVTKGDIWRVQVYASDGVLESAPAEDDIVIVNGAPLINNIRIEAPEGLYNSSQLTCLADIIDPDGDAFATNYQWNINGNEVGTEEGILLTPQVISPTTDISCRIQATDTEGAMRESEVTETIQNRIPELSSLQLTPLAPTTTQDLSISYILSDPDMDFVAVDVSWFVDGTLVQQGGDSLSSQEFVRDQVVQVDVAPSDSFDSGPSQSQSITILNTPPQGAIVTLDPENPVESVDNIHCLLETEPYDGDGDPITHHFSWNKNGSPFTGSTLNIDHGGDGIPASETSTGDIWECSYHAEDGTHASQTWLDDVQVLPNVCYANISNTHEVASCTVYETQVQENCVPASGISTCYPQYCDDQSQTTQPQHYSNGTPTGAVCSDWGQCEGNPSYDVSGQSGWSWVAGYWDCTYTNVTVPVTVYGGANCGYYDTCDWQQVTCGTPDNCTP